MTPDLAISIITVCRNSGETISKTIESILSQKKTGDEYIVIDGASTDKSLEIIASFSSRIDKSLSEPDSGIAHAFNKGIALAANDVIGLLNADDQMLPGTMDRVRRYFEEHPECQVLHGDVLLADEVSVVKRLKPSRFWWCPWRLVLFNHPATFVRKDVYEKWGDFSLHYRIAMDVEIFLRWKSKGVRVNYLPQPLVRMRAGGVSGKQAKLGCHECLLASLEHGYSGWLAKLQYWGRVTLLHFLALRSRLGG